MATRRIGLCTQFGDGMRVVITGSHGVGKTTLAASLLAAIGPEKATVVPETARLLVAEGFAVNDQMSLEGFLRYIHLFSENTRKASGDFVIFDRSLIDLHIYTRNLTSVPPAAGNLLLELIRYELLLVDLYVVVPVEFRFDPDGVRPMDLEYQREIDFALRRFLFDAGASTMEVSGTVAARTHEILEHIAHSL